MKLIDKNIRSPKLNRMSRMRKKNMKLLKIGQLRTKIKLNNEKPQRNYKNKCITNLWMMMKRRNKDKDLKNKKNNYRKN